MTTSFAGSIRSAALGLLAAASFAHAQPAPAPQIAGRHAELPGVKLWFTDTGGSGTPIVLLHANTGTSAEWAAQSVAFAQAGYRVVAFDRRGWGKSLAEPGRGTQPGTVAEDLDALADHLQLPRFHLVGIAGGGFVAIDYAAWRPERLRSLVIAASNGQIREKQMEELTARIDIPGLGEPGRRVFRELGVAYRAENPEGTARFISVEHAARQPGAPSQPMRTPNNLAKLANIDTPALILAGGADLISPPALMRTWAAHLKRYEFAVIHDAGHSIAWEVPEALDKHVLRFVARH